MEDASIFERIDAANSALKKAADLCEGMAKLYEDVQIHGHEAACAKALREAASRIRAMKEG